LNKIRSDAADKICGIMGKFKYDEEHLALKKQIIILK